MDYHMYVCVYFMYALKVNECTFSHMMCLPTHAWVVCMYVGLFEVSVTRWMALAYCHTKWREVKYVCC